MTPHRPSEWAIRRGSQPADCELPAWTGVEVKCDQQQRRRTRPTTAERQNQVFVQARYKKRTSVTSGSEEQKGRIHQRAGLGQFREPNKAGIKIKVLTPMTSPVMRGEPWCETRVRKA